MDTRKVSVLLADDEKHVRQLIKAVLMTLDCEVVGEAENGVQAVDLYKEKRPDVLLLDVNMPFKDGIAALREVKAFDPAATVIMLTSLSDMATIQTAVELGAAQYIRKDTPVAEMRSILAQTWQEHVVRGAK